jgi:hypothetical protein
VRPHGSSSRIVLVGVVRLFRMAPARKHDGDLRGDVQSEPSVQSMHRNQNHNCLAVSITRDHRCDHGHAWADRIAIRVYTPYIRPYAPPRVAQKTAAKTSSHTKAPRSSAALLSQSRGATCGGALTAARSVTVSRGAWVHPSGLPCTQLRSDNSVIVRNHSEVLCLC